MSSTPSGKSLRLEDVLPPCVGGISRRHFCAGAGAGLLTLSGLGCSPTGPERVTTGAEDDPAPGHRAGSTGGTSSGGSTGGGSTGGGSTGGGTGGGSTGGGTDGGSTGGTGGGGATCSGSVDCGAISNMAVGTARHFTDNNNYDIFVCRDQGGIFAMTALCPHRYCEVELQSDNTFFCNCHGAQFDFDGQHPTYPAYTGLEHYAVCIDGGGHVIVDYNSVVAASTRA